MQDLRLVGVHDGGEHLLLSGTGGEIFRLRIDEALRVAASRTPHRSAHPASPAPETDGGGPSANLSPRDIQARIRSGATAEDVAGESGIDLARIQRYEGPVRAERDYMAQQAQKVEVATALPSHDGYRSAFGDNPASLGEMVTHRLTAYGLDSSAVDWDAWRRPDGSWNLIARFEAGSEATAGIGEQPPAQWTFNPVRKTVQNGNRWAQVLSELEPMDGPLPARRLTAVADRVFDFEADKEDAAEANDDDVDSDNLLEVLRSRRGQRLGADENGDDALAMMLNQGGVPAAHPREGDLQENSGEETPPADEPALFPVLKLAPGYREEGEGEPNRLHDGVSTETREITISGAPKVEQDGPIEDPEGSSPEDADETPHTDRHTGETADTTQGRKQIKPKRSSVPSWDEIVFGAKGD